MLTDEIIAGVKQRAEQLYFRRNLGQFRVTISEARSIALYIAADCVRRFDPTQNKKFRNYVLMTLDLELPRLCAREGPVMQVFFNTKRKVNRRTKWSLEPVSISGKANEISDSQQRFFVSDPEDPDGYEELVEWCLAQLTRRRWQRIFYLRQVEGLDLREIADRLGVSHQAVGQVWNERIIPVLRRAAKCWY